MAGHVDPFTAPTAAARVAAYAELAARGPVVRTELPNGLSAWLVTGQAEIRAALSDERFTKSGTPVAVLLAKLRPHLLPAITSHMLRVDGPDHARLRKLVTAAFTRRPMEALDHRVEELTAELLGDLTQRHGPDDVVDLHAEFAYPLPMTVISELLGVPPELRAGFHDLTQTIGAGAYAGEEAFGESADRLVALLRLLVEQKRSSEPAEDLISALVAARDGGDRLSEDELTSMIWLLVAAGHETTVNLISSGVAALLANPGQSAALRSDPTRTGPAVEELLRFCSPVQVTFPVIAQAPVELGGVQLSAGDIVVPVVLAANRDPARVEAPDELDLTRSPNPHLAFGHGPHYCLGAPLARLEARIALTGLWRRFRDLQLAVPYEQLRYRPNFLFHGVTQLPVRLGEPAG